MILPNFIIGGAVASGTSFLSHAIQSHSQIYLPAIMRPECGFFYKSWEFSKGIEYYSSKWFADVKSEIAIGERSSLYFHGDFLQVAQRIRKTLPEVKLVFCLRNPTERAYANYRFSVLSGFEHLTFEKALEKEDERFSRAKGWRREIQPNLYRRRGNYQLQLTPFFDTFASEQILLIKSESLASNTRSEISKLYSFLGVQFEELPDVPRFPSYSVKSARLQLLYRLLFGNKMDTITENFRKGSSHVNTLEKLIGSNLRTSKMPPRHETREMLNDFYSSSNQLIATLTGWDISDWN